MFGALRHRNYRIFFIGQSISLIGTWMQQIAMSWLVYRMTDSVFLLGIVGFSSQIPTFLLAPFAGVIADRHHRWQLLLVTQGAAMVQAFVLAFLVLTHQVTVTHIIVLSFIMGVINAFDLPVRQAFTIEMVKGHADLSNAIALNSTMVNMARLVGPSIGGVMIAAVGEGMCFLINAVSFVAVIGSLLMMRVPKRVLPDRKVPILKELQEGFSYAFDFMPIRAILMLLSVVSMIAGGSQVLMPVFARDIFHGGSEVLGLLMACTGLGALGGAIYLASRKTVLGLGKVLIAACGMFGAGMIGFALAHSIPWALPFLVISSGGMIVQMASSNVLLQTIADEDKRGRVMSFYAMAFMGLSPFGSLMAGSIAHHYGAEVVFIAGGIVLLLSGAVFAAYLPKIRKHLRPVYVQKGILRPIVE